MTQITKVNSGGKYEGLYGYSRLVMVDNWIFTTNSAGMNPETGQFSSDPVEQARQTLRNLEHALAQVGSNFSDVVRRTVRIPNRKDLFPIMECVGAAFKGIDPASTVTCTPLGSDEYKLEIELIAYKGAGSQEQIRIRSKLFGE
jgi:enamine deaminase RidA (YjgF/YER057c/UK114 family)